jgi:hypothetical protein
MHHFSRVLYPACVSSTAPISLKGTEKSMSVSSARSAIFIEKSLPLSSSSSVRSGIDFRFAISLLTELEESKRSLSYKHCAPCGAGGISSLPIQDQLSTPVHNLGDKLLGNLHGSLYEPTQAGREASDSEAVICSLRISIRFGDAVYCNPLPSVKGSWVNPRHFPVLSSNPVACQFGERVFFCGDIIRGGFHVSTLSTS